MLIIDKGKKIVEGPTAELLNPEKILVEIVTDNKEKAIAVLRTTKWSGSLTDATNENIMVELHKANIPDLNGELVSKGVRIFSLRPKHSLEDYFLSVTKH
jgi:ABC-type multidrug transport system ATPase subunit